MSMHRFVRSTIFSLLSVTLFLASGDDTFAQRKGVPPKTSSAKSKTQKIKTPAASISKKKPVSSKTWKQTAKPAAKTSKEKYSKKGVTKKAKTVSPRHTSSAKKEESAIQSQDIKLKQHELEKIKEEIKEYETRLARSRAMEKSSLDRIDDYDRQTSLIRTLVSHLNVQITENKRDIQTTHNALQQAENELKRLQDHYARYIISAYKRGKTHDTELLLSSASLNQMFIRSKYLKAFTVKQKDEARKIREQREAVQTQKLLLEDKLERQNQTMTEKQAEETVLQKKTQEHKALLEKTRQDKEAYQTELRRRQAAAAKIERLIADLIERERLKRLETSRRKEGDVADLDKKAGVPRLDSKITALPVKPISETAFGKLKGRLPWPVAFGALTATYGEQLNRKLGTVTINNGIDIEVPPGSSVRAVADGEVSMVYFIAGYGNLIILNHDDGFFTVYAHLAEIGVRDGQKIKAGQAIAKSGEGISGPQLHFELWHEKQKQNPIHWLAKR